MKNPEIDAVIMWVDDQDPIWQKQRDYYLKLENEDTDSGGNRYRDWGTLKYLFRGIEKYAPWIRNIYFVTCGQTPKWLNTNHPKIKLVNHEDFIPKENLPTFSSASIDLNLWRIEGLSEFFIFFNDDMFVTSKVRTTDFVRKGKCCNEFSERPICAGNLNFNYRMLYCMKLLMKYYSRRCTLRKNWYLILNPIYGIDFFYNLMWYIMPYKKFSYLCLWHIPVAHKKSQWQYVYERDKEIFDRTISHKFRKMTDVSRFIYSFDQMLSGDFHPHNMERVGHVYTVFDKSVCERLCNAIEKGKYKTICINDECGDEDFEFVKDKVIKAFEKKFPQKSSFEN